MNPCTQTSVIRGALYHPYPGKAGLYIQCTRYGAAYIRQCGQGQVWDISEKTCNIPRFVNLNDQKRQPADHQTASKPQTYPRLHQQQSKILRSTGFVPNYYLPPVATQYESGPQKSVSLDNFLHGKKSSQQYRKSVPHTGKYQDDYVRRAYRQPSKHYKSAVSRPSSHKSQAIKSVQLRSYKSKPIKYIHLISYSAPLANGIQQKSSRGKSVQPTPHKSQPIKHVQPIQDKSQSFKSVQPAVPQKSQQAQKSIESRKSVHPSEHPRNDFLHKMHRPVVPQADSTLFIPEMYIPNTREVLHVHAEGCTI